MVRCPLTKIRAASKGAGRVWVTAEMTPEMVKVG
jgi:hypothetical protein